MHDEIKCNSGQWDWKVLFCPILLGSLLLICKQTSLSFMQFIQVHISVNNVFCFIWFSDSALMYSFDCVVKAKWLFSFVICCVVFFSSRCLSALEHNNADWNTLEKRDLCWIGSKCIWGWLRARWSEEPVHSSVCDYEPICYGFFHTKQVPFQKKFES